MIKVIENLVVWQNYVHYLLLTIVLTSFLHFNGIHIFHTDMFLPNLNFLYLYLAIFVADVLVHLLFSIIPEPFRWED